MDKIKGAMIEPAFWQITSKALEEAKQAAEKRTKDINATSSVKVATLTSNGDSEGAPHRTSDQLFGLEVVRFQAMRIAYFCFDNRDGNVESKRIVLNRIVSLKEDAGKAKVGGAAK